MKEKNYGIKKEKNKNVRFGLRTKLTAGIIIPLIVILILIGAYLSNRISSVIGEMKRSSINEQAKAAAMQADEYFKPFFVSARMLRDTEAVQALVAEVEAADGKLDFRKADGFRRAMEGLQEAQKNIGGEAQAVWLACVKNNQAMQSDEFVAGDAEGFVMTDRQWYKLLNENPRKEILTGAYADASTGNLVVTAASAICDENQNIIAITGIDISLEKLAAKMEEIKIGDTGFITLYDSDKSIIYHPDSSVVLKHVTEAGYSPEFEKYVTDNQAAEALAYERNGNKFHGSTTYLEDIGWVVLGTMPEKEFVREQQNTMAIFIGGFTLCALLLAGLCVIRANSMVRPIKKLNQVAGQLSEGHLDVEVPEFSRDEIGELSTSISNIVKRLKTYILYIDEVSQVLDDFGRGNMVFELKQEYVGEFNRLKTALNSIQESMSRTLLKITDSAESVASSAGQISTASQALAQGAVEQASSVEELSAIVRDLSQQSLQGADKAVNASREVEQIGSELAVSNQHMQDMLEAMNNITDQSNQISKIIKTVEDIAFQTNILALNAAVEAARAGEAGKGFSVVADEVRNLAGKSAEAAKNTTRLIQDTIEAMDEGSKIANDTAHSLEIVANKAHEIKEDINEISVQAHNQASSLAEVSSGIEQVSTVVQTNSATAEESAASSEELSAQANIMKGLTEQFIIDRRFHE